MAPVPEQERSSTSFFGADKDLQLRKHLQEEGAELGRAVVNVGPAMAN